ncbi:hypothetical protein AB0L06_24575 [Spirillospora sp. NPDC052269]
MNGTWNRRLLLAYPKHHRDEYGEEMLDVLTECGGGPRESADLVVSGLRMRLDGLGAPWTTPEWRDALAVVSLVAPLLMTIPAVWFVDSGVRHLTGEMTTGPGYLSGLFGVAPVWGVGALALAAAWWGGIFGRRFGIAVILALCVFMYVGSDRLTTSDAKAITLGLVVPVLALAGLAFSDGPRRGAQVLGRPVAIAMATVAGLSFAAQGLAGLQHPLHLQVISGEMPYYEEALVITMAVLVLNGFRTAYGRRVAALLVTPLLFDLAPWTPVPVPRMAAVTLGFALVLALGVRSRRRPAR